MGCANKAANAGRIALDPTIARIVAAMGSFPNHDLDAMTIAEALSLVRQFPDATPPPGSEDRSIDAGSGRQIRVRLYYPEYVRQGLPVLMHLHGGGFVTGTVEMDNARCLRLAADAHCIVASVDYGLAPEHPFPTPIEDAFAAWRWITTCAGEFGGDPRRAAISGSSAGGHLTVGVCLLARDRGVQAPLLQLLTYPVIDPGLASASYAQFGDGPMLTRARMAWFWKYYAGSNQEPVQLWEPLSGPLSGLPPALIITAECDMLRDEAETYAERLRAAGIAADVSRYPGMIHGFLSVAQDHAASAQALQECAAALRGAFGEGDD